MKNTKKSQNSEVSEILEKGIEKRELNTSEVERLLESDEQEILELTRAADRIRRDEVGNVVTYVINRNINYTNICKNSCKFCAFRKPEPDPMSYTYTTDEVREKTREAIDRGATEICFQGGINPHLDFQDYIDYIKAIRDVSSKIHIHAYSPAEISHINKLGELELRHTLEMLRDAGLNSVPGTAAEILVDRVRKIICPNKIDVDKWEKVIRTCHDLGIPTTATIMYGHVETSRDIANHLLKIRKIQSETGGFTEFVPLGFVSRKTKLNELGLAKRISEKEHLKMHAVARIALAGQIKNIQTSWVKLGPKLAQRTLDAGVNDFSGTLMEENITSAAGGRTELIEPEEIRELIADYGRIPRERTTTYDLIPSHQP